MSVVLDLTGLGNMSVNPGNNSDNSLVTKGYVDNFVLSTSFFVGQIKMYTGTTPPTGWLFCDGRTLNRSIYPELSKVIGSSYGGDVHSFYLPNLTQRIPIGSNLDKTKPLTIIYQGASTVTSGNMEISLNQLTQHKHSIPDHSHGYNPYYQNWWYNSSSNTTSADGSTTRIRNINSALNNTPSFETSDSINSNSAYTGDGRNYLPPFCVVNYIIYTGI